MTASEYDTTVAAFKVRFNCSDAEAVKLISETYSGIQIEGLDDPELLEALRRAMNVCEWTSALDGLNEQRPRVAWMLQKEAVWAVMHTLAQWQAKFPRAWCVERYGHYDSQETAGGRIGTVMALLHDFMLEGGHGLSQASSELWVALMHLAECQPFAETIQDMISHERSVTVKESRSLGGKWFTMATEIMATLPVDKNEAIREAWVSEFEEPFREGIWKRVFGISL